MNKSIFTVAQIDALLSAKGIVFAGQYASTSAVPIPKESAHYLIGTAAPYQVYTYTNGAWVNGGKWLSTPDGIGAPYIGENGNWFVYDTSVSKFVDSGITATGPAGGPGPKGDKGDPFTYEDFTEEQLDNLEKGAREYAEAAGQSAKAAQDSAKLVADAQAAAAQSAQEASQSEDHARNSADNAASDREIAHDYANRAEQAYIDTNELYQQTDSVAIRVKENAKTAETAAQTAQEAMGYAEMSATNASESAYAAAESAEEAKNLVASVLEPSDWEQNNASMANYVKNRTHWKETAVTEILPETQTVPYDADNDGVPDFGVLARPLNLVAGKKYLVTWNDVEYEGETNTLGSEYIWLFNKGANMETFEGLVFAICEFIDGPIEIDGVAYYAQVQSSDGSTEVTLSIRAETEIIHPLDSKYLNEALQFGTKTVDSGEITVEFNEEGMAELPGLPNLVGGQTYTVVWNGVGYEREAQVFTNPEDISMSVVVLGNIGLMMGGADTGEPFIIMTGGEGNGVVCLTGETSATFSIKAEVTKPIDLKYLPEQLQIYSEQRNTVYVSGEFDFGAYSGTDGATIYHEPYVYYDFRVGETYIVTWNGVEYECVAQYYEDESGNHTAVVLGDASHQSIASTATGNGEPFAVIVVTWDNGSHQFLLVSNEALETAAVTVSQTYEYVKKLDPKYLMDGTPGIETADGPVLPETVFTVESESLLITNPLAQPIVEGMSYLITLDGEELEAVAKRYEDNSQTFKTLTVYDASGGSKDYLWVFDTPQDFGGGVPVYAVGPGYRNGVHTLSIGAGYKVHKMDERCLPDLSDKTRVFWVDFAVESTDSGSMYLPQNTTLEAVWSAYRENKLIVGRCGSQIWQLVNISESAITFEHTTFDDDSDTGDNYYLRVISRIIWTSTSVTNQRYNSVGRYSLGNEKSIAFP